MFYLQEKSELKHFKSSILDDDNLVHSFTTRYKESLITPYNGFSLGLGAYLDQKETIKRNRKEICENLGIDIAKLIIPDQKHTDNVKIITSITDNVSEIDGLITNVPGIVLMLLFADCTPIIMYEPNKKVLAVVHAGWKGTAKKIAQKTISKMVSQFNADINSIKVAIGPAIGQCCYPVSIDVAEELKKSINTNCDKIFLQSRDNNKINVDLKKLNAQQLQKIGVTQIDIIDECTCCNNSMFFSYRAENGKTGRHSAIASIK